MGMDCQIVTLGYTVVVKNMMLDLLLQQCNAQPHTGISE